MDQRPTDPPTIGIEELIGVKRLTLHRRPPPPRGGECRSRFTGLITQQERALRGTQPLFGIYAKACASNSTSKSQIPV